MKLHSSGWTLIIQCFKGKLLLLAQGVCTLKYNKIYQASVALWELWIPILSEPEPYEELNIRIF